jgi:hypothetical protein
LKWADDKIDYIFGVDISIDFLLGAKALIEMIEGSETLKPRAREIRDEFAQVVTVALSECVGREPTDPRRPSDGESLFAMSTVAPSSRLTEPFGRLLWNWPTGSQIRNG